MDLESPLHIDPEVSGTWRMIRVMEVVRLDALLLQDANDLGRIALELLLKRSHAS